MMTLNVGNLDRAIRLTLGIVLLSLLVLIDGPLRYVGVIGIVPLLTGVLGYCPLYHLLGIDTCPVAGRRARRPS